MDERAFPFSIPPLIPFLAFSIIIKPALPLGR
jgi:hypothetical protein